MGSRVRNRESFRENSPCRMLPTGASRKLCGHLKHLDRVSADEFAVQILQREVQDFGHGSHRLSVCIVEPAFAVGRRVCSGSEEHGGKAVLNLPDIQFPVAGYCHGSSPPCLEETVAHIPFPGKIPGSEVSDVRFGAVEKSVLHNNLAPFIGFGMLFTGCYTIIGTTSFPHGALADNRCLYF